MIMYDKITALILFLPTLVVKNHCITNGGPEVNKPCVFPFLYDRRDGLLPYWHSFCTNKDSEKCWCYTEVDSNQVGVHGKWGYCGEVCSCK